jgi:FdhD protein
MKRIPKIIQSDGSDVPLTAKYQVLSVNGEESSPRDVLVCREESVNLRINGVLIATLTASPYELAEFACGYCITEGIIENIDRIQTITVDIPDIHIEAREIPESSLSRPREVRTSGCVGLVPEKEDFSRRLPRRITVTRSILFSAMDRLNDHAVLWRETGGTHCTVLFHPSGEDVSWAEDMGRHNSVDKTIGKALLAGIDPCTTFITCSGRMPEGMIGKFYRAGIPIVVTNNAPSAAGIDLARRVDMTLAGFVRPPRMNIYSVPERILLD